MNCFYNQRGSVFHHFNQRNTRNLNIYFHSWPEQLFWVTVLWPLKKKDLKKKNEKRKRVWNQWKTSVWSLLYILCFICSLKFFFISWIFHFLLLCLSEWYQKFLSHCHPLPNGMLYYDRIIIILFMFIFQNVFHLHIFINP